MTDEQDKSPGVTDSFLVRRLAKDAHITEVQARELDRASGIQLAVAHARSRF